MGRVCLAISTVACMTETVLTKICQKQSSACNDLPTEATNQHWKHYYNVTVVILAKKYKICPSTVHYYRKPPIKATWMLLKSYLIVTAASLVKNYRICLCTIVL